ncbi:hypothetical protein [Nocardia sp. NPDC048505]|uniref:hypothetical protein n=1 Tax=unclassified Nocardia TaxID=2637762 RepID=UPI0033E29CDD
MRRLVVVTLCTALAIPALTACQRDRLDVGRSAELAGRPEGGESHHPASQAPTPVPPPAVRVVNCLSRPQIRPADIVLTCADRNMIIDRITWDGWTEATAFGRGMESRSSCHPDCGTAPRLSFPVAVELSNPIDGLFTTLTKTPDGGVPEVLPIPR